MKTSVKQKAGTYKIQELRLMKGLNQEELAKRAGINRVTLSIAECGNPIRYDTAHKIAAAIGRDFDELFEISTK